MSRGALLDKLWEGVEPHVYITKDQFVAGLAEYEVRGAPDPEKPIAILCEKGPEFHFQPTGDGRLSRRIINDFLQEKISRFGFAVTKTPHQMQRQQRFNEALGFEVTGRDEYDVHYRITQIRGSGSRG